MGSVYAWLVVNGFLHSQKFDEIFEWLAEAAKKQGCRLERKTNTELLPLLAMDKDSFFDKLKTYPGQKPQFVIFWDKDVRLARLLEKLGLRLFNCAQSIEACDDKARTFIELLGSGIRMPKTVAGPKTFRPQGYEDVAFLKEIEQQLGYPMVVKECYGSFGQQVYLAHSRMEVQACLAQIKNRPCLFQQYIRPSHGHDIRIQMVGNQAIAAMHRYNGNDFRANITNGGSMEPYQPTSKQLEMAQRVMHVLNLDFAGVDILFGENGEPILCEVNSNAHFVNIYKCTGINTADAIIQYCLGTVKK